MLKKSLFSPAQPQRAETRLFPGFVLSSSKSSTGTRLPHHSAARTDVVLLIRRTVRPRGYASGFDSPATLLNGLFEHPARLLSSCATRDSREGGGGGEFEVFGTSK
jgi:hypothetical protein